MLVLSPTDLARFEQLKLLRNAPRADFQAYYTKLFVKQRPTQFFFNEVPSDMFYIVDANSPHTNPRQYVEQLATAFSTLCVRFTCGYRNQTMFTLLEFPRPIRWFYPKTAAITDYDVDHVWQRQRIIDYLHHLPSVYSASFYQGKQLNSTNTSLFMLLMDLVTNCKQCSACSLLVPHQELLTFWNSLKQTTQSSGFATFLIESPIQQVSDQPVTEIQQKPEKRFEPLKKQTSRMQESQMSSESSAYSESQEEQLPPPPPIAVYRKRL